MNFSHPFFYTNRFFFFYTVNLYIPRDATKRQAQIQNLFARYFVSRLVAFRCKTDRGGRIARRRGVFPGYGKK